MAEFYFKDLVHRKHVKEKFLVESAATTSEEICGGRGNPVYPPARRELLAHGIDPVGKRARLLTGSDYRHFDHLIGMDDENLEDMLALFGGDPQGKISLLLDYVDWERTGCLTPGKARSVADPWYTRNFQATWDDVEAGCNALFSYLGF